VKGDGGGREGVGEMEGGWWCVASSRSVLIYFSEGRGRETEGGRWRWKEGDGGREWERWREGDVGREICS
jgi:hypothetical protein